MLEVRILPFWPESFLARGSEKIFINFLWEKREKIAKSKACLGIFLPRIDSASHLISFSLSLVQPEAS
jgi:hypothetical protein